mmetsp:Transcript_8711/g.23687  ORF Transcript_8711/g.23687 Transcript_8711/m.23687 type:complete len:300 (+) Transcript_8711:219-1118(+)
MVHAIQRDILCAMQVRRWQGDHPVPRHGGAAADLLVAQPNNPIAQARRRGKELHAGRIRAGNRHVLDVFLVGTGDIRLHIRQDAPCLVYDALGWRQMRGPEADEPHHVLLWVRKVFQIESSQPSTRRVRQERDAGGVATRCQSRCPHRINRRINLLEVPVDGRSRRQRALPIIPVDQAGRVPQPVDSPDVQDLDKGVVVLVHQGALQRGVILGVVSQTGQDDDGVLLLHLSLILTLLFALGAGRYDGPASWPPSIGCEEFLAGNEMAAGRTVSRPRGRVHPHCDDGGDAGDAGGDGGEN